MVSAQKRRKIRSIYRRWLDDEKFFKSIADENEPEYGDNAEVLRNLGSAIAYAIAYAKDPVPSNHTAGEKS